MEKGGGGKSRQQQRASKVGQYQPNNMMIQVPHTNGEQNTYYSTMQDWHQ